MSLRPYQEAALLAIKTEYIKGTRQQLLSMATGTGKTVVFSHLTDYMNSVLPGQMIVYAHTEELIDQAVKKIREYNPKLKVDKEKANHYADPSTADVIVASVQTLGRKGTERLDRFNWERITKHITDEAHHSVADSYKNIYNAAGIFNPSSKSLLLGCTATPTGRGDGKALAEIYKKIVFSYSLREAIEDGWLADVRGIRVNTKTNLDKVKTLAGDFVIDMLADAVNNPIRNQLIVDAWKENADYRQTIVFCVNIQHSQDLAKLFRDNGICAEAVWGNDPERAQKLKDLADRKINVICNCNVLTEGFDCPIVACIVLARPTKSHILFNQMVGRGTRLFEGKADLLVLDVVDNSSKHSLITLPTLMGLNSHLDLRGRSLIKSVHQLELAQEEHTDIDFSELRDITNLKSYVESVDLFNVRFPEEVEENSELSWHKSADGGFVILLPNKIGNVHIRQNMLDKYEISGIINGKRYKGERERIEDAFGAADNLLNTQAAEYLRIIRRQEKWHSKPPTMKQMNMLRKIYRGKALPNDLDRGKAAILITRFLSKRTKC